MNGKVRSFVVVSYELLQRPIVEGAKVLDRFLGDILLQKKHLGC